MWKEDLYSTVKFSAEPTSEELKEIEKDIGEIISSSNSILKSFSSEKGEVITDDSLSSPQFLTTKELEMIEEMTLIATDPYYISDVRKKRLKRKEEKENSFMFSEYKSQSGDFFDSEL